MPTEPKTAEIVELRRADGRVRAKRHYDKKIGPRRAAARSAKLAAWHRVVPAMDACWAAGHFEGEGAIFIHKKNDRVAGRFSPRVALNSTDKEVVEFFCKYWPATIFGPYQRHGKANSHKWKPCYRWGQTDQFKVREFLRTILPYLKRTVVRERAEIVIEFCDRALAAYRRRGQEEWKELLYDKLKPLNKRGR